MLVKIGPRRQVTIPKEILKKLHTEEGDRMDCEISLERFVGDQTIFETGQ